MAKKLTKKQREANIKAAQDALKNKKTMHVNLDAVVTIELEANFRNYLEEAINYLFSLHDDDEITQALIHIQTNFKNIPEDAPPNPFMNALWTLMSLTTAINYQAVAQGDVNITDVDTDEEIRRMIKTLETMDEQSLGDYIKSQKMDFEKMREQQNNLAAEKKAKNTNED
tara:strand:+ start:869 stop:1378 length:510 start_codon:yes stop_codon:yes gene_type:complete